MTPEQLAQVEDLFHRALECDSEERRRILSGADLGLRHEVGQLLSCHEGAATCLENVVNANARSAKQSEATASVTRTTDQTEVNPEPPIGPRSVAQKHSLDPRTDLLPAHTEEAKTLPDKPALALPLDASIESCNCPPEPDRNRRSTHSRPSWWMYLMAMPFLAQAVFITAFCFFGPESMGIDVRQPRQVPLSGRRLQIPRRQGRNSSGDVLVRGNDQVIRDINYWYWFLCNARIGQSDRARY